jgi:hypothetical protein
MQPMVWAELSGNIASDGANTAHKMTAKLTVKGTTNLASMFERP